MALAVTDEHVRVFAKQLAREIAKYGPVAPRDFLARQKAQVERLDALEERFRKQLLQHGRGKKVYEDFVVLVCDERRNILSARPFFRERQAVFAAHISDALKLRDARSLHRWHFNYQFVRFAMRAGRFTEGTKLARTARAIAKARGELIEMNMPLAMSRARLFWSRTPESHLSYMDMVQICAEGLIAAVDKYCLPFSRVFRSVGIGRMVGDLIANYSETPIKFYPNHRRKIYRANKLIHRFRSVDGVDWVGLAAAMNAEATEPELKTTPEEIADLMLAASCISGNLTVGEAEGGGRAVEILDRCQAPEASRPDVRAEEVEREAIVRAAVAELPILHRKILRLKGILD